MIRIIAVGLMIMGVLLVSPAIAENPDRAAQARELLELSGMEEQIRQIPAHVLTHFQQQGGALSPELRRKMTRIIEDTYSEEKLQRSVLGEIEKHFDSDRIEGALVWLRSPLARKITALEEAASTPQGFRDMQAFATQLQSNPPRSGRVTLAHRLDQATKGTETLVEIIMLTAWGAAMGANAVIPKDQKKEPEDLWRALESQRQPLTQALKQTTLISCLYTYQSLTDSELEEYLRFAESDVGKWYHRATSGAVQQALLTAALETGKAMAQGLTDMDKAQKT